MLLSWRTSNVLLLHLIVIHPAGIIKVEKSLHTLFPLDQPDTFTNTFRQDSQQGQ
jgi:hypothetical protein